MTQSCAKNFSIEFIDHMPPGKTLIDYTFGKIILSCFKNE